MRQIIEHHIAMGDAEGRVEADGAGDHIIPDIADLGQGLRLRVGVEHNIEFARLGLTAEGEIDAGGQGASGRNAGIVQIDRRRTAAGGMDIGEARQHGFGVDFGHPTCGLDDEDAVTHGEIERPAPGGVGQHHGIPIGNHDIGDPAVGCGVNHPAICGSGRGSSWRSGNRQTGGRGNHLAAGDGWLGHVALREKLWQVALGHFVCRRRTKPGKLRREALFQPLIGCPPGRQGCFETPRSRFGEPHHPPP